MSQHDNHEEARRPERGETYKHLEDPLRLGPLTVRDWLALLAATFASIVFGVYVSPLPELLTISICILLAGAPVALSYAISGFDDLSFTVAIGSLYRWARGDKHYLPGGGFPVAGYQVTQHETEHKHTARPQDDLAAAVRRLEGAWDQ